MMLMFTNAPPISAPLAMTLGVVAVVMSACASSPDTHLDRAATITDDPFFEWGPQHVSCPPGPCQIGAASSCSEGTSCALTLDQSSTECADEAELLFRVCCTPGSRTECGDGAMCLIPLGEQPPFPAFACEDTPNCQPVGGSGCGDGQNCYFSRSYGGYTTCIPAGPGGAGAPCESTTDCGIGMLCVQDAISKEKACARYCELSTGQGCSGSETCIPFIKEQLDYGSCR